MSDKDIGAWPERLKDQVLRSWENYKRFRIDLSTARTAEFTAIAGEFFYIEEVSSASAAASIRLNRNTNDPIDLQIGVVIKTIFKEFYITNDAQADEWIDIIIGINFEYSKRAAAGGILVDEAQPILPVTALANINVTPPANPCNRALVKADVYNTQPAWIDFGMAAVQNACLPLDAGEWIEVKISNTNRININFEVNNELVFVVFEV